MKKNAGTDKPFTLNAHKRNDNHKGEVSVPVTPTYPGVYIEKISSGIHTITGVSTSVAAFVGPAKKGPIDKAVHIFNFDDFERCFGGLFEYSEMSYALHQFFSNGGNDAWVVRVAKNTDAATFVPPLYEKLEVDDRGEDEIIESDAYNIYIASRAKRKGIYALEDVDIFNILCLPGISDSGILMDAISYCQERRAFMIIDAPRDINKPAEMIEAIKRTAVPKSDYAAIYYPWIQISDPLNSGKLRSCSPSGTIAGLYARTDSTRGVWKSPAGMDATLSGVQGVDYLLTDMENGTLNPLGVNCIRIFPLYGTVAWGSRTLHGSDQMISEYKYIPTRRLALFIEESLYRGTQWVVFEPNDETLWSQVRLNIGTFMHSLFRQGAFQGKAPKEAYFVKCNNETTTQDDINKGIVNIAVGFAPLKPAEFVIIQIQQMAGQIQA
jgi:phage tail sheath protein FI